MRWRALAVRMTSRSAIPPPVPIGVYMDSWQLTLWGPLQVMAGLACDVEVHSAVLTAARSVFLNIGESGGSISRGLLGSIRMLAG